MSETARERAGVAMVASLFESIRDPIERIDRDLERLLESEHRSVEPLLRYIARYRGKRMRPAMVFLTANACGRITSAHHQLAMVLEILHTATLIHDDIIDEADVRRQQESVNRRFGNEKAVLLGDYLFSEAMVIALAFDDPGVRSSVARLCRDICLGEVLEVCHRFDPDLTEPQYLEIIEKKTATLFETGCGLAARMSGVPERTVEAIEVYARNLGLAFQVVDDCLDLVGEETSMGKSLGNDVTQGMITLPIIRFLATATPERREAFRAAFVSSPTRERSVAIQRLLRGSGAVEYAYEMAETFVERARGSLARIAPSAERDAMREVLDFVLRRIC